MIDNFNIGTHSRNSVNNLVKFNTSQKVETVRRRPEGTNFCNIMMSTAFNDREYAVD